MNREDVAEQLSRTDAGLVPGAVFKTVENARSIVQALQYLVWNTPAQNMSVVTEYGQKANNVDMIIKAPDRDPETNGRHYRRRVIIVEDWTEVSP